MSRSAKASPKKTVTPATVTPATAASATAATATATPATAAPASGFDIAPTVVTHHELLVGGKRLKFAAKAGSLVLADPKKGTPLAELFTVSYVLESPLPPGGQAARPLTFAFNGGPGASSIWVHLGALGPWRVSYGAGIRQPAPTTELQDNPLSWLAFTDLVFVDPVGTGYSRALGDKDPKDYWGVDGDATHLGELIRLYCTVHERWASPKFLAGESYGGLRAAALCRVLQGDQGMDLAGVVLISPAVDYATNKHAPGNHIAHACALPSFAAVAHHHGKLGKRWQSDLAGTLAEAERFALDEYLPALARGSSLSPAAHKRCVEHVAELTGLSPDFVERSRLAPGPRRFAKELLRDRSQTVGRFDARLTGVDADDAGEAAEYDPADLLTTGPFVAAMNDLLRRKMGVTINRPYKLQDSAIIESWVWETAVRRGHGYINFSTVLRRELAGNERLHLAFVCGLYDIVTPYFGNVYTMNGMHLTDQMQGRVSFNRYPGGHMVYTDEKNHAELTADMRAFYERATAAPRGTGRS